MFWANSKEIYHFVLIRAETLTVSVRGFYLLTIQTNFEFLAHGSIEVFSTISPRATIRIEGRPLADKWPGERTSYRWVVLKVVTATTFVEDFLCFGCHGLYILDFPQLQIAEPLVLKLPRGNTEADAYDLTEGAFADFLKSSAHRRESNVLGVLF